MNFRREFEIAFVGLKPGVHEFEYHVGNRFFEQFSHPDFVNCEAVVKLQLDKKSSFMLLKFDIDGKAEVSCDRCGNPLVIQLWDEFKIMVKMADDHEKMNEEEEDPDVYYISKGESHLHLADWIYEFVSLSIPVQNMCAEDEIGGPKCNAEVLKKLEALKKDVTKPGSSVWKGLEQFKNLQ